MTVTATIDSVGTTDAHPSDPPHRISNIPGWDRATVALTVTDDLAELCCSPELDCSPTLTCGDAAGSGPIRSVRLMFRGATRAQGELLMHRGVVCGLSVCGGAVVGNVPLRMESGTQIGHDIHYDDLELMPGAPMVPGEPLVPGAPPPDGDYPVAAHGYGSNSGEWSPSS